MSRLSVKGTGEMKVKVLKSFAGYHGEGADRKFISAGMNDIIELPEGTDWLKAGLVEPVKGEAESAAVKPAETAAKKPAKKRTRRKSTGKG